MAPDLNRYLPKEAKLMIKKQLQICSSWFVIGKCKWKLGWNTLRLLECLGFKRLTTPNAEEDMEPGALGCTASGNVKWHDHFWKQFGHFLNVKSITCHVISLSIPRYLHERFCKDKDLDTNIFDSFLYNGLKLETTQMCISIWMDNQILG